MGRYRLPIGGQRDVPEQEWLRQLHPSQEAERPRYARDDAAGQQCEIENPLACRACVRRAKGWGYSSELSGSPERCTKIGMANALSSCATSPSHDRLVLRKSDPFVAIPTRWSVLTAWTPALGGTMMCATPIVGAVLDVVVWLRSLGPTMWCCAKISVTSSSSSNAATFRAPLWENPKRRVAPALGA